jgi:soluble lytic murein transglycosylase-like protein
MTLVLLLQAPFDLNDEKPTARPRRISDAGPTHQPPLARLSGARRPAPRPQLTQRVLLCAPATFRGQRIGTLPLPASQRILFVDPQGWVARRGLPVRMDQFTGSPCSWRPMRMHSVAYTTSLPQVASDMSTVLQAARRHVRAYQQPTANTLAMAAGTAAVAILTHYWHSHTLPPVVMAMTIEPQQLTVALPPPPMIDAPYLVVQLSRRAFPASPALPSVSISDVQRLLLATPVQAAHGEGFDLDITSPTSLWAMAGARYHIDPVLIYAVALVESKSARPDGSIAPSPWVVRINGRIHSGSRGDLERAIQMAHRMAWPVQDVGIMQVYYPVHRDIEPDPIALLNPVRNIEVGTGLLRKAMQQSHDPVLRIGYYHSHDAALARGYGQAVLSVYRELKFAMSKSPSANAVALARAQLDTFAARSGG